MKHNLVDKVRSQCLSLVGKGSCLIMRFDSFIVSSLSTLFSSSNSTRLPLKQCFLRHAICSLNENDLVGQTKVREHSLR
jgi:hypothetical protein